MSSVEFPPPDDAVSSALYALVEKKTVEQLTLDLRETRITEAARVARAAKQFYTASGLALVLVGLGYSANLFPLVFIGLFSYFTIAFFLVRLMYIEFERQANVSKCENAILLRKQLDKQGGDAESA